MKSSQQTQAGSRGFTLLELVIVIAIFGLILTAAYQILITTIVADERIDQTTRSGKIGETILSLIRKDLQGTVFRGFGRRVFEGISRGEGEEASDVLDFLSTARVPEPPLDIAEESASGVSAIRYVLNPSENYDGAFTLFRGVNHRGFEEEAIIGEHIYTPIYNRVKALSITYLDSDLEWKETWTSEERIPDDENLGPLIGKLGLLNREQTTTDPFAGLNDDEIEEETIAADEEDELPWLPLAVRIELFVYLGDEKGLLKDNNDQLVVEKYTTIIPLLAAEEMIYEDPSETDEETDER